MKKTLAETAEDRIKILAEVGFAVLSSDKSIESKEQIDSGVMHAMSLLLCLARNKYDKDLSIGEFIKNLKTEIVMPEMN